MMSRRSVLPILLLVFFCCTGFHTCIFIPNPAADMNVAVNHDWIVTGTNTSWTFSPVPGSGNANAQYRATSAYFATPGHPCAGLTLFGEPMVYTDPTDGRFWFHINDGRSGCLFASAGPDPRGPFIRAFITPVADGLWLTVTRDKVVLMGFTVPLQVNALVFNRGDLIQQVTNPRFETVPLPFWSHPIHNKTAGPYQNDAWLMGRGFPKADGRRVIHFTKITGVPGVLSGLTVKAYDVPLPSNDMPFFEPDPEVATQPDGSLIHFANGTPGMWTNSGSGTGLAWIFQAGEPNGTPRLGLYGFDLVNFTDGPRYASAEFIDPPNPYPGRPLSTNMKYGCPTLAVLNSAAGQRPILGISFAAPFYYLTAYQMGYGGLWFQSAGATGPMASYAQDTRLDFCVGTTTADPATACAVQAYDFSPGSRGAVASANTYCTDQF